MKKAIPPFLFCIILFFLSNIALLAKTYDLLKIADLTNGVVCNSKQSNEINILLTKQLSLKLRKIHANSSYHLKSVDDKSVVIEIPKNFVNVGRKYLTIKLYVAEEIPEGNYSIEISNEHFSAATESFKYLKPFIVKGFTGDLTSGIASARTINGSKLSLGQTLINSNGTFEIEINKEKILSSNEPIIVNIKGRRDLNSIFNIGAFNLGSEIIVNDISTIITSLIKNKKDLALNSNDSFYRVSNGIKEIILFKENTNNNCDISKFANLCNKNDNKAIGVEIKGFIQSSSCDLPQSIKNFIFKTSDEELGKSFCESQKLPICSNGQTFTVDIPCNCVQGSTLSEEGICTCPKGQSYTEEGCIKGDICKLGQKNSSDKPCVCSAKATGGLIVKEINGLCTCVSAAGSAQNVSDSIIYTSKGCVQTSNVCKADQENNNDNPCACKSTGANPGIGNIGSAAIPSGKNNSCECTNTFLKYTLESGCVSEAAICGVGQSSTTSSRCTCAGNAVHKDSQVDGICICPDGTEYTIGGCKIPTCQDNQKSTSDKPCDCASGAKPNDKGICTCPKGQSYTEEGCIKGDICKLGQKNSSDKPCVCSAKATGGLIVKEINGLCTCVSAAGSAQNVSDSIIYTSKGCVQTSNVCKADQENNNDNPCACKSTGANPGIGNIGSAAIPSGKNNSCECTNTFLKYTLESGCVSEAAICGVGQSSTTSSRCTCAGNAVHKDSQVDGICICPKGQTYTENGCVKAVSSRCPSNKPIKCQDGSCSDKEVNCPCPKNKPFKCPDNICAVNSSSCKKIVESICLTDQISTISEPCKCATGGQIGSDAKCQCPNGQIYTALGCVEQVVPTCIKGQISTLDKPCICTTDAALNDKNVCVCFNGGDYSEKGCGTSVIPICANGQIATTDKLCVCAAGAVFNDSNTCFCLNGGDYSERGCSTPTVTICRPGQASTSLSPCDCIRGAAKNLRGICECFNGAIYSNEGCP